MSENELGLGSSSADHYNNTRFVTKSYFSNSMRYFKEGIGSHPWNSMFLDQITTYKQSIDPKKEEDKKP